MAVQEVSNSAEQSYLYKYHASGYYILGTEKYQIDYTNFRSIVIDYDYRKNNMPTLYAIMNLSTKLIDLIVKNKETGVFILNIQKCQDNSNDSELWVDYINDTFVYLLSEDVNKTDSRDYENANEGREDIYKEITVGLISQNLVNNNKKVVNGILNCNSMTSAIYYTLGNRPIVLEPLENNVSIKNVFLPPVNSVAKAVKYLNKLHVFYNTPYRYFMDFDVSYLLSSKGKAVPKRGDKANSVLINLRNDYDMGSRVQGMTINAQNGYYALDVGAGGVEVADYREKSKSFSNIQSVNTTGSKDSVNVFTPDSSSNFVAKTMNVRAPNDNAGLIENSQKSSMLYISINKNDLDGSIFTPNKEYVINTGDIYPDCDYSGNYILHQKRELYFKSSDQTSSDKLVLSVMLFFEKVYE